MLLTLATQIPLHGDLGDECSSAQETTNAVAAAAANLIHTCLQEPLGSSHHILLHHHQFTVTHGRSISCL